MLAISEKCTEVSESQCVSVNGESIVLPSTYEPAGVEAAAVATGDGQSAVDVTFTDDGAADPTLCRMESALRARGLAPYLQKGTTPGLETPIGTHSLWG